MKARLKNKMLKGKMIFKVCIELYVLKQLIRRFVLFYGIKLPLIKKEITIMVPKGED